MHPVLPEHWKSKSLRVAMSDLDWARFDALVAGAEPTEPSAARAHGVVIGRLMETSIERPPGDTAGANWMDWERQKTLRLLRRVV